MARSPRQPKKPAKSAKAKQRPAQARPRRPRSPSAPTAPPPSVPALDLPKLRKARCATCAGEFTVFNARGPLPTRCPEHDENRRRRAEHAREAAAKSGANGRSAAELAAALGELEQSEREKEVTRALEAAAPERIAVGLVIYPDDPRRAAMLTGLDPDHADFARWVEQALEHSALTQRDPLAMAKVLDTASMLLALALRSQAFALPSGTLAPALKQLTQTLEGLRGSARPVYSEIVLKL